MYPGRWGMLVIIALWTAPSEAAIVYQDFEVDNGTPVKTGINQPEYGWAFGGAFGRLTKEGEPVHSGRRAWAYTLPVEEPLQGGTGIPSQTQTYHINFVPECHDRLTFWIWSDPSRTGPHTVMVKFFDQGIYKRDGIGIWTEDRAADRQWSQLKIPFQRLPADFDLERVDKIEFYNYWDGTYYYDDIEIASSFSAERDRECLRREYVMACHPDKPGTCRTIYDRHGLTLLNYLYLSEYGGK